MHARTHARTCGVASFPRGGVAIGLKDSLAKPAHGNVAHRAEVVGVVVRDGDKRRPLLRAQALPPQPPTALRRRFCQLSAGVSRFCRLSERFPSPVGATTESAASAPAA
eukprot:COSAG01_NODE_15165_length_1366_cov_2.752170_1_plen_108_part_10